ncbi:MAG: metallophosphoesterase [Pseudomonadota bacterium]
MWKFFLTFLITYGTMHSLFYHRVRVLLPDQRWIHGLVILLLVLLLVVPLSSFPLERSGHVESARVAALIGFNWMGFLFFASILVIGMDIFDILSWIGRRTSSWQLPTLWGRGPAMVMLASALLICLYGVFEARRIRVERITVATDKLPAGTEQLRIAQISDVHLGLLIGKRLLSTIIAILGREQPHIVASTGDLLDSSSSHTDGLSLLLKQIQPRYGKYAVTGNHEYYPGLAHSLAFLDQAGFTVLRNQVKTMGGIINIAGVDDPAHGIKTDEVALLSSITNNLFTLFLKHRPYVPAETQGLFDLQLSGHTHKGQLFPFGYVVSIPYPYLAGFYPLGKESSLYTSRGTGTWGPSMRVLSPPEVTIIDVVSNRQKSVQ